MSSDSTPAGLSMAQFHRRYGTEAQCEEAIARARWPQGFRCPRCGGDEHSRFARGQRSYWQCSACRHQVSVLSGTIFQASKLPLTGWFLAMHLLSLSKNNLSALELARHLGVSYRTAWTVKHKLLEVMHGAEATRELHDAQQITARVTRPRGAGGAQERMRFHLHIQADAHGKPGYIRLVPQAESRQAEPAPSARPAGARMARGARGVARNVSTALSGCYRGVDYRKYGHRYLAESQYRFNHRHDLDGVLDALTLAATRARPVPEKRLRWAEVSTQ